VAAIVRSTGWDRTTIRKYLRAASIDARSNPIPDAMEREIVRLHLEGKSTRQIATVPR
jgi:hypothetical protein